MSYSKCEQGLLPSIIDAANISRVFPGVRGTVRKKITVQDSLGGQITLAKGTQIIIQPLNLDKPDQKQNFNITVVTGNKEHADSYMMKLRKIIYMTYLNCAG